ncbi:MAG: serpin family protein [Actinomyces sp.]|nr:serpin family protein [Actinomyces sp.]
METKKRSKRSLNVSSERRGRVACAGIVAASFLLVACNEPGDGGLGLPDDQPAAGTVVDQGEPLNVDIKVGPLEAGSFDSLDDQARVSMYAMGLSTVARAARLGGSAQSGSADEGGMSGNGEASVGGDSSDTNVLTSPVGTATAIAQIALGARGQTRAEFERLMGLSADDAANQFSKAWNMWDRWNGDPGQVAGGAVAENPLVARSMRMVLDDDLVPDPAWLHAVTSNWDSEVADLDLQSASAKEDLDSWVNERSGGLVDASAIQLDENSRLVGQNAVVFSAPWAKPFDQNNTRRNEFYTAEGPVKLVDTMHAETPARAFEDDKWTAGTLPYKGDELVLHILMPHEGTQVSPASIDEMVNVLGDVDETEVDVSLPKVDFTSSSDLLTILEDMGAPVDLGHGDFSGFGTSADEGPAVFLDQFVQQGRLIMKEKGTVAAAVTEFGGRATAPAPPPMLVFDHPYLAIIAEMQTNTPLFMTWIGDPSLVN